jgi:hypothetical protein
MNSFVLCFLLLSNDEDGIPHALKKKRGDGSLASKKTSYHILIPSFTSDKIEDKKKPEARGRFFCFQGLQKSQQIYGGD